MNKEQLLEMIENYDNTQKMRNQIILNARRIERTDLLPLEWQSFKDCGYNCKVAEAN